MTTVANLVHRKDVLLRYTETTGTVTESAFLEIATINTRGEILLDTPGKPRGLIPPPQYTN